MHFSRELNISGTLFTGRKNFHGCLFEAWTFFFRENLQKLEIVHARFFFHRLKSAKLFTGAFTGVFLVENDHGLLFSVRVSFRKLFTDG